MRPYLTLALLPAAAVGLFALTSTYTDVRPAQADDPTHPRVRLAVLVVFDQMRGDYPARWRQLYGSEGFARIMKDGAWFTNCHYPYGTTTTGPGHASILSGTCPDQHGIVNNNWYENGRTVYCAGSDRHEFVPAPATPPKVKEVGFPSRMLAETVGDVLKRRHREAKVFGLSLKDRSAIFPTGKHPDGAYWFNGRFVTSTYYADRVRPWVERFNTSKHADRWFGKDWTHFRPELDYAAFSGPDVAPGEGKGVEVKEGPAKGWSQKVDFPHPNTGGRDKPGKEYYEALANSPFGNELLLQFAKECVTAEHLGEDDVPDLLVVSFSSNDLIGHTWGPDSQEVLDVTLRSDAVVAELMRFLDDKVGPDHYLVGITADHGICPLVEASRARGVNAKRVDPKQLLAAVEDQLTKKFGVPVGMAGKKPAWVESVVFPWVYFNPKLLAAVNRTPQEAAAVAVDVLRRHADVERAFTGAELAAGFPPEDAVGNRVRRSYFPGRSGDVYVVLKEWFLPSASSAVTSGTGTTHGAPFGYDTHVPLMLYGPGIGGGASAEPTTPQAMAAIFSKWLGLRVPSKAEFPVPKALDDE